MIMIIQIWNSKIEVVKIYFQALSAFQNYFDV